MLFLLTDPKVQGVYSNKTKLWKILSDPNYGFMRSFDADQLKFRTDSLRIYNYHALVDLLCRNDVINLVDAKKPDHIYMRIRKMEVNAIPFAQALENDDWDDDGWFTDEPMEPLLTGSVGVPYRTAVKQGAKPY